MCLLIDKKAKKKKTTSEMVVYKLLRMNREGSIVTPFTRKTVINKKLYRSRLRRATDGQTIDLGLHSFKLRRDAMQYALAMGYVNTTDYYLARCTIPKGSSYYEGKFSGFPALASTKLKYNKITRIKRRK